MQALLHREQDIGVAAGLDIDDPIWMKTGEMKGRGKQVAPAQAPEDGTFHSRQDSRQKDRRTRLVREIGTAHHFMESTCSNASARQSRRCRTGSLRAERLRPRYALANLQGRLIDAWHSGDSGLVDSFLICSCSRR